MLLRRFILPATAAALAVIATAPLVADQAAARPAMPILPGDTPMERLQAENQMLRRQLQIVSSQRQDIATGLDRIEQVARSSRDPRTARRIAMLVHDLEARAGLDQPWDLDVGYDAQPGYPPGYPSQPGYPQGYPSQPGYPQGYPSQPGYPQGYPATPPSTTYPSSPPGYPSTGPGTIIVGDRRPDGRSR